MAGVDPGAEEAAAAAEALRRWSLEDFPLLAADFFEAILKSGVFLLVYDTKQEDHFTKITRKHARDDY